MLPYKAVKIDKINYRTSHQNSSLFAVTRQGEIISHTIYDVWGLPEVETYIDTNYSGIEIANFTGYTWDEVGELYFAQNRFYDPNNKTFIQKDPIKDGTNWYAYCGNNPVNYIDWDGLDAMIIGNSTGAYASNDPNGNPVYAGHMAVVAQNKEGAWHYFSAGETYVTFTPVDNSYFKDLETFSKQYYTSNHGAEYDQSVYIKGDFSESVAWYKEYSDNNEETENKNYNVVFNNCSDTVMKGINKGKLPNGLSVSMFTRDVANIFPKNQMKQLQNNFYNNAFSSKDFDKQLNDKQWIYESHPKWSKRDKYAAEEIRILRGIK